ELRVHYARNGYAVALGGGMLAASAGWERQDGAAGSDRVLRLTLDGVVRRARVLREGSAFSVLSDGAAHSLTYLDPLAPPLAEELAGGHLAAPMPGRIIEVRVAPGAAVKRGQALLV